MLKEVVLSAKGIVAEVIDVSHQYCLLVIRIRVKRPQTYSRGYAMPAINNVVYRLSPTICSVGVQPNKGGCGFAPHRIVKLIEPLKFLRTANNSELTTPDSNKEGCPRRQFTER